MPTIDACRIIATLRPGMPASEAAICLAKAGLPASANDSWAVRVSSDRKMIDIIDIRASFAAEVAVHGVNIGMSIKALSQHPLGRRLIPGLRSATEVTGSYLVDANSGWEMIVEADARRGVYHIILERLGLFQERMPAGYADMENLAAKQDRDKAEAIASAGRRSAERERLRSVHEYLRNLTDPDELLDYWSRHDRVWGDGGPDLSRYAEWLRAGDPLRWHSVVTSWNWDNGLIPLRWIASRPNCDAATALTIFYNGEPADQLVDSEEGQLIAAIRERWSNAGFLVSGIRFDTPSWVARITDMDRIPPAMRLSIPGRMAETETLDEGFPLFLRT
ncbi:DUF4274 domain-containing protein [uncultured Sphingomonas sp.]|uniref:DUF4274 domain-containing protein n=1 Tax=uncultured Sphingomonas sp. TaxID=158754 RepID=UPI0035CC8381